MTNPSVGQLSLARLQSIQGKIVRPPRTVAEVVAEVIKIGAEADRLARELPAVKTNDAAVAGALHRTGAILRDMHTAFTTATASLSADLKKQIGVELKKGAP